jgi:hypothetical protein
MRVKKEAEIARCAEAAACWVEGMTERELTMFALGLYAGEGDKTGGDVAMANTNPLYLGVFLTSFPRTFEIDEARLRVVLYLHEGLDLDAATEFWSQTLNIPREQFTKPYRRSLTSRSAARSTSTGVLRCATRTRRRSGV